MHPHKLRTKEGEGARERQRMKTCFLNKIFISEQKQNNIILIFQTLFLIKKKLYIVHGIQLNMFLLDNYYVLNRL